MVDNNHQEAKRRRAGPTAFGKKNVLFSYSYLFKKIVQAKFAPPLFVWPHSLFVSPFCFKILCHLPEQSWKGFVFLTGDDFDYWSPQSPGPPQGHRGGGVSHVDRVRLPAAPPVHLHLWWRCHSRAQGQNGQVLQGVDVPPQSAGGWPCEGQDQRGQGQLGISPHRGRRNPRGGPQITTACPQDMLASPI